MEPNMTLDELMQRPDLTWKAKGLAIAVAMKAEKFKQPGPNKIGLLIEHGPEREASIRSGLRQLEETGILKVSRVREQGSGGAITGSTWEINVEWP